MDWGSEDFILQWKYEIYLKLLTAISIPSWLKRPALLRNSQIQTKSTFCKPIFFILVPNDREYSIKSKNRVHNAWGFVPTLAKLRGAVFDYFTILTSSFIKQQTNSNFQMKQTIHSISFKKDVRVWKQCLMVGLESMMITLNFNLKLCLKSNFAQ